MDTSGDPSSAHHAQLRVQGSPPPALLGCAHPPQASAEKGWPLVGVALVLELEVVEREGSGPELGRQQNEAGRGLGLPRPAATASLAREEA